MLFGDIASASCSKSESMVGSAVISGSIGRVIEPGGISLSRPADIVKGILPSVSADDWLTDILLNKEEDSKLALSSGMLDLFGAIPFAEIHAETLLVSAPIGSAIGPQSSPVGFPSKDGTATVIYCICISVIKAPSGREAYIVVRAS
jgi:hypothetical protein